MTLWPNLSLHQIFPTIVITQKPTPCNSDTNKNFFQWLMIKSS